jgi:hypothetical protein
MRSLFLSVLLAAIVAGSAFADSCAADPDCILAGYDYFVTQPGTFFTIAGVVVPLLGIPDPSNYGADTIVQRLGNIDVPNVLDATETVHTQMMELQLTGLDPNCPQPGVGACDVTIKLDPGSPTLGTLTFTQTVNGEATVNPSCGGDTMPCEGTFTSFFDVFFDLSFTTQGGAPLPCDPSGDTTCLQPDLTLTGSGSWTDDNGAMFIAGGLVTETHPTPPGVHDARQIPTPEPGALVLFGTVLSLVALWRRRQARG